MSCTGKNMYKYLLIFLLTISGVVYARMYQWVDPDSGSTQLSGKPPVWYRSKQPGPRVFVFERNRIIDDTGIAVSDSERKRLRQQAFLQADEDSARARERLLRARRLDAAIEQKQVKTEKAEVPAVIENAIEEPDPEAETPPVVEMEDTTMEQMKKLIADWEKTQTEKARNVLENPGSGSQ